MVRTHTQARGQARGTTGFFAELNYQPSRLRSVAGSRQRRRTALKLPGPSSIPAVKEYRYVKAKDEIVPTSLPVKAQKNRYANAVWQVTVRALHEIFEADRAGKPPASRSAAGRTGSRRPTKVTIAIRANDSGRPGGSHRMTRQTVIAIEHGHSSPYLEVAFQIARVFDAPLDDVFQYPNKEREAQ